MVGLEDDMVMYIDADPVQRKPIADEVRRRLVGTQMKKLKSNWLSTKIDWIVASIGIITGQRPWSNKRYKCLSRTSRVHSCLVFSKDGRLVHRANIWVVESDLDQGLLGDKSKSASSTTSANAVIFGEASRVQNPETKNARSVDHYVFGIFWSWIPQARRMSWPCHAKWWTGIALDGYQMVSWS